MNPRKRSLILTVDSPEGWIPERRCFLPSRPWSLMVMRAWPRDFVTELRRLLYALLSRNWSKDPQ